MKNEKKYWRVQPNHLICSLLGDADMRRYVSSLIENKIGCLQLYIIKISNLNGQQDLVFFCSQDLVKNLQIQLFLFALVFFKMIIINVQTIQEVKFDVGTSAHLSPMPQFCACCIRLKVAYSSKICVYNLYYCNEEAGSINVILPG